MCVLRREKGEREVLSETFTAYDLQANGVYFDNWFVELDPAAPVCVQVRETASNCIDFESNSHEH